MTDFYLNKIVDIMHQIQYLTLATISSEGNPYNAPVFSAFDDQLNFYWSSDTASQHSRNIADNEKAFVVIYDSTVAQGTGWGVYLQAEASEVTDHGEIDRALSLLGARRKKPFDKTASDLTMGPQKIYKLIPTGLWINEANQDGKGEYIGDYRLAVDIDEVRKRLYTPRV